MFPPPIRYALFAILAAGTLAYFAIVTPVRNGDGLEYWYQVESLVRHFSPELREDDEAAVNVRFPTADDLANDRFADIDIPPPEPIGYATTADGRRFGAHFWGYALSAVPARWLLDLFGGHPMASLQLTNAMWFLLAAFVVLFRWDAPLGKKAVFVVFAFVGPAWWYVAFTGAETFSWAFSVLAVVSLDERKFARCSLLAALGALQNPPLVFLAGIGVLLAACARRWREAGLGSLATLVAFLPPAFYLAHFGKPSLILNDATSLDGISVSRTLGLLFDPNQGMGGYIPVLPFAAAAGLILKRSLAGVLVAVALAGMFATAEMQTNWNAGAAGLHRYLIWMVPLFAWLAADGLRRRGKVAALVAVVLLHIPLLLIERPDRLSHLAQRPLARWLLTTVPQLYSPSTEMFFERQFHGEVDPLPRLPVGIARPDGVVTKFLVVSGCDKAVKLVKDEYVLDAYMIRPDYWPELQAIIAAAGTPTYVHPPEWAVHTNPGALDGRYPERPRIAPPRWR